MSFVEPHYSDLGEPVVSVMFRGTEGRSIPVEVVVDTGFNRGLLIYESDSRRVKLPPSRRLASPVYLFGGQPLKPKVTTAYIEWLGGLKQIDVLVLPDPSPKRLRSFRVTLRGLLGMELLRGTNLLIGRSTLQITKED